MERSRRFYRIFCAELLFGIAVTLSFDRFSSMRNTRQIHSYISFELFHFPINLPVKLILIQCNYQTGSCIVLILLTGKVMGERNTAHHRMQRQIRRDESMTVVIVISCVYQSSPYEYCLYQYIH